MNGLHIPRIVQGAGCLKKAGELARELRGTKALIVTDPFLLHTCFFTEITDSLSAAGLTFVVFSDVRPNPRCTDCDFLVASAASQSVDIILGFGGGSSLDLAKAAAVLLANGKRCADWDGLFFEKPMVPTICIPTTSGTGSEATFVAVITDEAKEYKMSLFDPVNLLPSCALCDPLVTLNLPPHLTASCGLDALTHAIEAYTSKASSFITDQLSLRAVQLLSDNILTAYSDGGSLGARDAMMSGSTLAGIAFIHSNVGAVHAVAETLGARYDIPHGVANALFLPYVMKFNLPAAKEKYAALAAASGLDVSGLSAEEAALKEIDRVRRLCRQLQIPTLPQLSCVPPRDFRLLAERCAANPLSLDNARPVCADDYEQILLDAYGQT